MDTTIISRLKELELENARLSKMYAVKVEILKEAILTPRDDGQTGRD